MFTSLSHDTCILWQVVCSCLPPNHSSDEVQAWLSALTVDSVINQLQHLPDSEKIHRVLYQEVMATTDLERDSGNVTNYIAKHTCYLPTM